MVRGKATILAATLAAGLSAPVMAQTEIKISTFGGSTNIVAWTAIDKGFFEKEGLKVTAERTHGSKEQQMDVMAGKYQFASTSFDNVVAYHEGEGETKFPDYDVVAIGGVHQGTTSIIGRPEIKKYADIKGKPVAVDSASSGYATAFYQIVRDKGGLVQEKDYSLVAVGGTRARVKAMEENKAVAAVVSMPSDMELVEKGYNKLGDVAVDLGAYQGSVFIVRKSYASANPKIVEGFMRAIVAANDFVFSNKAETIAVLKKNLKDLDDAEANKVYDRLIGPGGLNKRAELSTKGIENVLKLRSVYGEKKDAPTDPKKYVDLSYYEKAVKK